MKLSKAIIIDSAHADQINAALAEVQGKAKVRTVDFTDVLEATMKIELRLDIPKKAMHGVSAYCNPHADRFPKAYKYIPVATQFRVEYRATNKWYLTEVYRNTCDSGHTISISAPEHTKTTALANLLAI